MAVFSGGPGLAGTRVTHSGFYWMLLMMVTTGAVRRVKIQSVRCYQQINTRCFTGRVPFLSCNQQCQSTKGN